MTSRTMTARLVGAHDAGSAILQLFQPNKSYWESLPPHTKADCVDRNTFRQIWHLRAFNAIGPLQVKWNEEVHPRIRAILRGGKAEIFRAVGTEIPFVYQLYMIEVGVEVCPAVVTICYNMVVGQNIIKLIKRGLRASNIGLRYYAVRHFLNMTGGGGRRLPEREESFNACGRELHLWAPGAPVGAPKVCVMGGCILIRNTTGKTRAYGISTAHALTSTDEKMDTLNEEGLVWEPADSDVDLSEFDVSDDAGRRSARLSSMQPLHIEMWTFCVPLGHIADYDNLISLPSGHITKHANIRDHGIAEISQYSFQDDWLLVPLDENYKHIRNRCTIRGNVVDVKRPPLQPPTDQLVQLVNDRGTQRGIQPFMSTTLAGLYMPVSGTMVDVYTCSVQTAPGDSGTWAISMAGEVLGTVVACCGDTTYLIPMLNTLKSIKARHAGVDFPAATAFETESSIAPTTVSQHQSTWINSSAPSDITIAKEERQAAALSLVGTWSDAQPVHPNRSDRRQSKYDSLDDIFAPQNRETQPQEEATRQDKDDGRGR